MLRERGGEDRARSLPHLRTARRGVSVATTGTLSRVLGARTGAGQRWQASGLRRSLAGKEWGQSGGFARCKGGERAAAAASRGSSMAAASPANGRWRHCEAERGVADYARAPNRSASHGGSGEGAAGCASEMRRAARAARRGHMCVDTAGPARAERERRGLDLVCGCQQRGECGVSSTEVPLPSIKGSAFSTTLSRSRGGKSSFSRVAIARRGPTDIIHVNHAWHGRPFRQKFATSAPLGLDGRARGRGAEVRTSARPNGPEVERCAPLDLSPLRPRPPPALPAGAMADDAAHTGPGPQGEPSVVPSAFFK